MSSILVYIATSDGKIKRSSLEVLSHCRTQAEKNGYALSAVVLDPNAETYTETLQRLENDKNAIGVFGLSFYQNNTDKLRVGTMGGVVPSTESIASGEYPVSRPLFFYV